jgi:hypothetical protein
MSTIISSSHAQQKGSISNTHKSKLANKGLEQRSSIAYKEKSGGNTNNRESNVEDDTSEPVISQSKRDDEENECVYYTYLLERYSDVLLNNSLSDICGRFNQLLKEQPEKTKVEMGSWFYALTLIHRHKSDDVKEDFPYKPKHILCETPPSRTQDGENVGTSGKKGDVYFLTYTLANISSKALKGVLLGYMIDCLNAYQ